MYETIKDWACHEYGIDPSKVVRPFYPGGDYLMSEAKAAELKAAEDVTVWPLNDKENRSSENSVKHRPRIS